MKNATTELAALHRLVCVKFDAEQAALQREKQRESDLQSSLDLMSDVHKLRSDDPDAVGDPAWLARADLQWATWAEQRRVAINMQMATSRAKQAQIKEKLRVSFGKQQALAALMSK